MVDKEATQEKLDRLLTALFGRHPKLNYFQGYHDIGDKECLRLADSKYSDTLGASLSRALQPHRAFQSLHIPAHPFIQPVLDYILCRPSVIVACLVTAIIICRKELIQKFEDDDEDESLGMAHSLLSTRPAMIDEKTPVVLNPDGDVEGVDRVLGDEGVKVEEARNANDATEKSPDGLPTDKVLKLKGDALPDDEGIPHTLPDGDVEGLDGVFRDEGVKVEEASNAK
ncbi:hypothetical protein H0H93_011045 [Arthromyces matolae]|nr:hypothetical protein H0H93_011045 [Arthromyces matolae]